jgi:hypothetical protein
MKREDTKFWIRVLDQLKLVDEENPVYSVTVPNDSGPVTISAEFINGGWELSFFSPQLTARERFQSRERFEKDIESIITAIQE